MPAITNLAPRWKGAVTFPGIQPCGQVGPGAAKSGCQFGLRLGDQFRSRASRRRRASAVSGRPGISSCGFAVPSMGINIGGAMGCRQPFVAARRAERLCSIRSKPG